jgi:hypothetical protein
MSKRDNPIKEWNAVTYLKDFINTYLVLTEKERLILEYYREKLWKQSEQES